MKKKLQKTVNIYIMEPDYQRLSGLIEITRERNGVDREYLNKLEAELDRAEVVDPKDVPAEVITMRSQVRLKDLVSGEANTYSLVFPKEANFSEGKISILAPIGTAILGYKEGDTISGPYPLVCADSKLTRSFISRRLPETMSSNVRSHSSVELRWRGGRK